MFSSLLKLVMGIVPLTFLVVVLGGSFWLVHSDSFSGDSELELSTPVMPQAVLIEANSPGTDLQNANADGQQPIPGNPVSVSEDQVAKEKETVWQEIRETISSLNELVGEEMFLDVVRGQKGQMEVHLDRELWNRVRYQTRADLKTDISNLWHLYVSEYGYVDSSAVYFLDDSSGRVIDIFSKAR